MVVRAVTERHSSPIWEEFGLSWATKLFGEDVIAQLPRFVQGPKAGKIKAHVVWRKVIAGGWDARVGVVRGGTAEAWIASHADAVQDAALRGVWLGRNQMLCGHGDLLNAEARKRAAIEHEAVKRDRREAFFGEVFRRGVLDGSASICDNAYAKFEHEYPGISAEWERGRTVGADQQAPEHVRKIILNLPLVQPKA